MANNLRDWNARLEAHFRALAEMRRAGGLPVFALEHGLDASEREGLAEQLNASLARGERTSKHWLLWVVYSAEQGYDYDGEEFWETFERRTPRWTQHFYRRALRTWFGKFHDIFEGFNPTGPWARWFSIIACPITHAVLPRDLQLQLARALFDWRHALAKRIDSPPADLGHFLATVNYDASSRFRNFLQQEEIVGRIVIALLGGRTEDVERFIHPDTLERIVTDLQKVGSGRAWLQDARKAVERARLHGTSSVYQVGSLAGMDRRDPPIQERKPEIRPALTLRRVSADEWTPVVELPSLRALAEISSDLSKFLRQTRCRVLPENEGGLCVVACGEIEQALIVSMPAVVGGLQGLLVKPNLANLPYSPSTMPQIADLISLWSTARLVGPLAGNRRDRAATALRDALRELVCGADWIDAEVEYSGSRKGVADLKRFVGATGAPAAFNFVVARDVARFQTIPPAERTKDLIDLAQRYKIASREACSHALHVASWLERGGRWSEIIAERITSSKEAVSLTRAARFITVATSIPFEEQPAVPQVASR